jgi:hypothetical protein
MYKYRRIRLNRTKTKDEHRIVMEKKLGRPLTFNEVIHHKNGDKKCNEEWNLELMSRSAHSSLHMKGRKLPEGTRDKFRKYWAGRPKYYLAKFTYSDVQKMKALRERGLTYRKIAAQFNVDHVTILNILNGKTLCYRHMLSKAE